MNKNLILFLIASFSLGPAIGKDAPSEAEELTTLKQSYARAVEKVNFRVDVRYRKDLGSLQAEFIKAGRMGEARQVEAELERINKAIALRTPTVPSRDKLTEMALIGTKWIYPYLSVHKGQGEMLLEFKKNGKTRIEFRKDGGKWEFHYAPKWSISGEWTLNTLVNKRTIVEVSKNIQEMTWKSTHGKIRAVRYLEE